MDMTFIGLLSPLANFFVKAFISRHLLIKVKMTNINNITYN